jgi:hypothetical protein
MLDSRFRNLACTVALLAGCSVLNSFDEVGPIQDGGGSGGSSGSSDAGDDGGGTKNTAAGSGMTDAGEGGTMMMPEGGTGGGSAGQAPMSMGGEGGSGETPVAPPGLIVVSGTDTDLMTNGSVLSVLSPQTGKELRRDSEVVPMFAHDGIRDLWYVGVTKPGKVMGTFVFELGMRAFDRTKNEWIPQGTPIEVPPPADASANGWVALRSRFAYIYKDKDVNTLNLQVIDATDPAQLFKHTTVSLAPGANGMIGSFGNNPGGTVNIVRTNSGCIMDVTCNLTLAKVQVKATGMLTEEAPTGVATVPNPNGKGALGANRADGRDVVVTPNSDGTVGTLIQLNPSTHAPLVGEERTFPINARQLGGFAYDACTGVAFTSELVAKSGDTTIYALPPPGGGTVGSVQPAQFALGVFFEPYTRTLIAPFSSGNNHDILAYSLSGMPSSPKLNKRTAAQWSPPVDLDPKLVAVASPHPAECQ